MMEQINVGTYLKLGWADCLGCGERGQMQSINVCALTDDDDLVELLHL